MTVRGGLLWAAVGVAAGLAAGPLEGTLAGGAAWVIACAAACAGYGGLAAQAAGATIAPAAAAVVGLAMMLVPVTLLGPLGLWPAMMVRALVIGGAALAALPAGPWDRAPAAGAGAWRRVLVWGAAAALVALALVRLETPVADGANHALAVKRLWDTGVLEAAPYTSGLQIAGEALLSWGGGAQAAGVFDAFCAALLLLLLASTLPARGPAASLALLVGAAAIVLDVPAPGQAAATLWHFAALLALDAALLALDAALGESGARWLALGLAAALALVRHELVLLATPYAAAAVALPWMRARWPRAAAARAARRRRWLALGAWLVATCAAAAVVGLSPARVAVLAGAVPVAALLVHLLGPGPWQGAWGAWGACCLAIAGYLLAVATYAIPPAWHSAGATGAALDAVALLLLVASAGGAGAGRARAGARASEREGEGEGEAGAGAGIRPGAASLVIGAFAASALILPSFGAGRGRGEARIEVQIEARIASAVIALRERLELGADGAHEAVRRAQLHAPAGARLAFWGRSAARLDLARNPVRDVSYSSGVLLGPIAPRALAGADYLLLEDLRPAPHRERGARVTTYPPALDEIGARVELISTEGTARLYRVRE